MQPALDIKSLTKAGIDPLHFEQYLGVWSVEPSSFLMQWRALTQMNLLAHMKAAAPTVQPTKSVDTTGLARIDIRGTMTKQGSSLSDAGSTVLIRQSVRSLRDNAAVDGVMVVIESGGGTVAGNQELTDDLWSLSQAKPTVTFVEDMMGSAATMAGSQSRKIFANTPHAIVGSVGTYFGMYDTSGAASQDGIVPILISTGDLKGGGFDGLPISDDVKAMWKAIVDQSQVAFIAAMQRSRKFSADQMAELSRGGVFSAQDGIRLGLIDGIMSFDSALAELRAMVPKKKGRTMSDQVAATLQELKQVCRGAEPAFIMEQMEANATVASATSAWTAKQNAMLAEQQAKAAADLKAKDDELAKMKADLELQKAETDKANAAKVKAEEAAKGKGGGTHRAVPDVVAGATSGGGESAKSRWNDAIKAETGSGRTLEQATKSVIRNNPELHQAYVAEANENAPRRGFQPSH